MAVVATFTHIPIASCQLQSRVGLYALDGLGGGLLKEQGHDLDQTTESDGDQDQHDHQKVIRLHTRMGEAFGIVIRHVFLLKREQVLEALEAIR